MSRFSYLPLLVVALATAVIPLAESSSAEQRPATLEINVPTSSVCVSKTFTVGVWYQQYSGGSRAYRIAVYNPGGARIFYRLGTARSSSWTMWSICAMQVGKYHTVYYSPVRKQLVWSTHVFPTYAHHC
jgi:hypothetical protein